MQLPPAQLVTDALRQAVLPPAVAGAVVFAAAIALLGRRGAPGAAVLALAAGWAAGNYARGLTPWLPGETRIGWLPWVAVAAGIGALLARSPRLPAGIGWAIWAAAVALGVARIFPAELLKAPWWSVPAFVLASAAAGVAPARMARRDPGAGVPLLLAFSLFAAGGVVIHAGAGGLMDAATIAGSSLAGTALVALVAKADAGAALPGAGVFLTGTLLSAYHETFSDVPWVAFLLPAVAPPLMCVVLIPRLSRLTGFRLRLVQFAVVLIPLAVAVAIAESAEPMNFENM
jgi:hypothetical protein